MRKTDEEATATRAIRRVEDSSQPMMVIGCATAKESRLAMFKSSAMFAISANTREIEFIAMSLHNAQQVSKLSTTRINSTRIGEEFHTSEDP